MRPRIPNKYFGRAYQRFLELPVLVVLTICWLLRTPPIALCALALYMLWLLLQLAAES